MDGKGKKNGNDAVTQESANTQDTQDTQGKSLDTSNVSGASKEKTFTQDQVKGIMEEEKKKGMSAVYKELGIDPNDSKSIKMIKALIDSQKSGQNDDKGRENDTEAKEFEERVLKAEIKAEAMVLEIKQEFVDDMVVLVMSKISDDTDVRKLLGEYKKKYPSWFKDGMSGDGNEVNKNKVGQRGTGSSIKGDNGGKSGDNQGMGKRLATRRNAAKPKKSYWG